MRDRVCAHPLGGSAASEWSSSPSNPPTASPVRSRRLAYRFRYWVPCFVRPWTTFSSTFPNCSHFIDPSTTSCARKRRPPSCFVPCTHAP
eukprot:2292770-Pyramimonas_sp.AAC.1